MAFEHFVARAGQSLRLGFTTGTCAALAAGAAARMLLGGKTAVSASLVTPKGIPVETPLHDVSLTGGEASCAVKKDAGDDPDVTDGVLVYATVAKRAGAEIVIDGGDGVGRVTRAGLDQPPGAAAINSVPRKMITQEVDKVRDEFGYDGGLSIVVSIPGGREIAAGTFNPHLGIVGGISVIGTSGIVEPMSTRAVLDTIRVEMNVLREDQAGDIILTPGNYGENFLRGCPELTGRPYVKCSNFIGDALDIAGAMGFSGVLVVGHIGKLIKLSGGIMDTHSRVADCRLELLALHAALAGMDAESIRAVLTAATVDDGLSMLGDGAARVAEDIVQRAEAYVTRRAAGAFRTGVVMFSNRFGLTVASKGAGSLLQSWRKND